MEKAKRRWDRGDKRGAAFAGMYVDGANPCKLGDGWSELARAWHGARTAQRSWEAVDAARRGDWEGALGKVQGALSSWGQFAQPCFASGTPVLTPDGWRAIEAVVRGDVVLTRDEHDPSGAVVARVVEEVFTRSARILVVRAGGQVVRTTQEHPFYVEGKGWTPAGMQIGRAHV